MDVQPSESGEKRETAAIWRHIPKNLLTGPEASVRVRSMSHRNSALFTHLNRFIPVVKLLNAREISILVLVLVLLITNGGAG
jgi:hypothetical protein